MVSNLALQLDMVADPPPNNGFAPFERDFYPTPPALVSRMLRHVCLTKDDPFLEPSAGKGDIAQALSEGIKGVMYGRAEPDIDVIEIDAALRHVLSGQGFRVVHDDFLTFDTFKQYGTILMNPPFSEGDRHLLKALEMQQHGGKIVCLLNAETLRNPHTRLRKDLVKRLVEVGARIEYLPDAFATAERKTGVEAALIEIDIPQTSRASFILDGLRKAQEETGLEAAEPSDLAQGDFVEALIGQYNFEAKAGLSLINEYRLLVPYMLSDVKGEHNSPILELQVQHSSAYSLSPNAFLQKLRMKYWRALFADSRFMGMLTNDLQRDYTRELDKLADFDFTFFNIATIRERFCGQVLAGIDKAIEGLFDTFSHKYHWQNESSLNVHYYNGWCTNKAWKVNKKVIRPYYSLKKDYGGHLRIEWRHTNELDDIERVFRYLDGKPFSRDHPASAFVRHSVEDLHCTRNIHTPYFTVSVFLKGTVHITFHDDDLLKKFNLYGSQKKRWLPPSYGKKAYRDMAPEEQSVVDSFEGEAEYARTMERPEFFLSVQPQALLMGGQE